MPATTVDIDPNDPKSIDAAMRTEWLLTNGLGGYAMGTVLGANTRRYHGLLIAATKPPVGRIVALHSMIEELIVPRGNGQQGVISLSTQCFGPNATLHPDGWRHLTQVVLESPLRITWHFRVDGMEIMRRLSLDRGAHAATLEYEIANQTSDLEFRVRPFLPLRDFHSLDHQHEGGSQSAATTEASTVTLARDGVHVRLSSRQFAPDPQWWNNFAYPRDRERGQDWMEDVRSPGMCSGHTRVSMRRSTEIRVELLNAPAPDSTLMREVDARLAHAIDDTTQRRSDPDWNRLAVAGRQFLVGRHDGASDAWTASVIAGYPWFGDWGRDTMISLPGLMLCIGRLEEAQLTLSCYARHLRNGLIPNLFDDYGGAAHYNTVDASLWFVNAVYALHLAPRSDGLKPVCLPELITASRAIIAAYRRGTDFGIHMDENDGLVVAGDERTQLTWMDAARDGVVFTPRCGKAVEINALWHNALLCLSEMTEDDGDRDDLVMLAQRVADSFRSAFWWNERQCLHDCLAPPPGRSEEASRTQAFSPDGRVRPNQIFAVSLPFSPLNETQQNAVVKIVGERLLTPFGLRTLDRDDPNYKPRYEGNLFERDAAYHNGTVWPWLIGPHCEALLRVEKYSDDAKRAVREILQPLVSEMSNTSGGHCLNQIAEVYDAEPPHRSSGCPAQAWSVAEILRILTMVG